jgi:hypothetical protein
MVQILGAPGAHVLCVNRAAATLLLGQHRSAVFRCRVATLGLALSLALLGTRHLFSRGVHS